jgi:hypothetical protein
MDAHIYKDIFDKLPVDERVRTVRLVNREMSNIYRNEKFRLRDELPYHIIEELVQSGKFTLRVYSQWSVFHPKNQNYLLSNHLGIMAILWIADQIRSLTSSYL